MPNDYLDQLEVGGTTYDLQDSAAQSDLSLLKSQITQIFDEKYNYVPSSEITEKGNTFIMGSVGGSPTEYSNAMWRTETMSVSEGEKYRITASFWGNVPGTLFVDSNNKIVAIYGLNESDASHTFNVTVPDTAVLMIVNDKKSSGFKIEEIVEIINNDLIYIGDEPIDTVIGDIDTKIGVLTNNNVYTIGTGKMKSIINLNGSENGSFNFSSLAYDNNVFKSCSDDISPIQTDGGYIGGNHGLNRVYDARLVNHGLTTSDIGKTCEIDGNTWVLLKVVSDEKFFVGCVDANAYGLKTVSPPPTTFNFGASITVTSISLEQLRPIVKNIKVAVKRNDSVAFEVAESYDIVSPSNGITYIMNHVGENTNDTIVEQSDVILTVRNLYSFANNGACVLTQNLKVLNNNIHVRYYGGTQSGAFGQTDYFAVPMTSYDALSPITDQVDFVKTTWSNESTPPIIYCQADSSGGNANKMMVQGYIMANRNDYLTTSAGFVYTTRKMYPYAVQPYSDNLAGTTYSFISFRLPIYKGEMSNKFEFCSYCKVQNAYYFFCFSSSAVSDSILVPSELCGKKIETVMSKNATCNNTLVADSIDVVSTGESYLLLKLTD